MHKPVIFAVSLQTVVQVQVHEMMERAGRCQRTWAQKYSFKVSLNFVVYPKSSNITVKHSNRTFVVKFTRV